MTPSEHERLAQLEARVKNPDAIASERNFFKNQNERLAKRVKELEEALETALDWWSSTVTLTRQCDEEVFNKCREALKREGGKC